jgi:hypothetical protein
MERIYGGRVAKQAEVTSRAFSKYFFNLLVDFNEEESPIRPEAAALASRRIQTMNTPTSHCLPLGIPAIEFLAFPFKIFQAQEEIAVYCEAKGVFRQFTSMGANFLRLLFRPGWDIRPASGKATRLSWTRNDKGWMDNNGHPRSAALHIQELFHRRDFGHLDV